MTPAHADTSGSSDRRPRVAFLTHSAQISGAELVVERLSGTMEAVRPIILLGEHGPLADRFNDAAVPLMIMPLPGTFGGWSAASGAGKGSILRSVWALWRYCRRLSRALHALQVDIVYTHSAKAHIYGGLAARMARIPVVAHQHVVINAAAMSRQNRAVSKLAAWGLSTAVIANSQSSMGSLGGWINRKLRWIIPPPLPSTVEARQERTDASFVVLLLARISEQKGQSLAIEAFAQALPDLPPNAVLRIVGEPMFSGDMEYAASVQTLATELGRGRVLCSGFSPQPLLDLAEADVALHCATSSEGFGQTIAEAMAVGTPVIASRDGGPSEIITNGVDGCLIPANDREALRAALVELCADADLRRRYSAAGRLSSARFAPSRVARQTEAALLTVLRSTGGRFSR